MRLQSITLRTALILFLSVGLVGCSQQAPPPANDHSTMQESAHQETHASIAYDWKIKAQEPIQAGKPIILLFDVNETETGSPLGDLSVLHEKTSHLIIVRKDLSYFSHIHPDVLGPGKMQVKAEFPQNGEYILYLQFAPSGQEEQTLRQPFQVGQQKTATAQLKPDADKTKTIDGYTFKMASPPVQAGKAAMVELSIEKNGKPLTTIEPYLGAGGHAVLLSEDAKSFLHVHPASEPVGRYYQSPLQFHTEVAEPGLYKMWIQVQIDGKVETVDFTFQVK